jgi:hypothetical protein
MVRASNIILVHGACAERVPRASSDRAIQPALQRTMTKAIKATTIEVAASHVAMLSKPEEVAKLIENATAG